MNTEWDTTWHTTQVSPGPYMNVLITPGQLSRVSIGFQSRNGDGAQWFDVEGLPGQSMPTSPTHWMPLPVPPS